MYRCLFNPAKVSHQLYIHNTLWTYVKRRTGIMKIAGEQRVIPGRYNTPSYRLRAGVARLTRVQRVQTAPSIPRLAPDPYR